MFWSTCWGGFTARKALPDLLFGAGLDLGLEETLTAGFGKMPANLGFGVPAPPGGHNAYLRKASELAAGTRAASPKGTQATLDRRWNCWCQLPLLVMVVGTQKKCWPSMGEQGQ